MSDGPDVAKLIREARTEAGLTQAQLAARLGMTQPAIARLERPGCNPTVGLVDRVLRQIGQRYEIRHMRVPDVDEDQIRAHLRMTPAERLRLVTSGAASMTALKRGAKLV